MGRLIGILAITACLASPALGTQSEFDEENIRARDSSSRTPIVFSFKGGIVGAMNFEWYHPTGEQARSRFSLAGITLEAHDLRGLVAGLGADYSWNTWTREDDVVYYGRAMQRLNAIFLYGTIGRTLWQNPAGSARSWCSFDIGKMWCNEEPGGSSTATLGNNDFTGVSVRVRASYLRHITRTLALGVTGGWQWAKPTLQNLHGRHFDTIPRLKLSGPMIAAHISLVSLLGKR